MFWIESIISGKHSEVYPDLYWASQLFFLLLGASATSLGAIFSEHRFLLKRISGIIVIIMGLFYAGILNFKYLNKDFKIKKEPGTPTFLKSILFGLIFAFGWTPCIGPLVASALMLAADEKTVINGIILLFSFSMGLSLPLVISALLFNRLIKMFDYIKKNQKIFRIVSGILLIMTGLLIYFRIL
jgi:cytochrome c-type biogenesis protein